MLERYRFWTKIKAWEIVCKKIEGGTHRYSSESFSYVQKFVYRAKWAVYGNRVTVVNLLEAQNE